MRKDGSVSEWRAAWPVVLSSMIGYGNGFGLFILTSSSFIAPVKKAFGWSTGQASIAPITAMTMAVLFPFAGRLIDRWGARPFAIGGLAGLALCFLAMAMCPANIVFYRGLALLVGISCLACGPMTFTRGVGGWFEVNRGTALGFTIGGLSLGGLVGIPFAGFMIENYGWRSAYGALAASIVVIGLPLVVLFFREHAVPPSTASAPVAENSISEPLGDARLWLLLAAFTFAALPIGVFASHLVPILSGRGFSPQEAGFLGSFFAGSIGIARIGIGMLVDRLRDYMVAAIVLAAAGAGAFALFHAAGPDVFLQTQLMLCLIGLAYGAEGDLAAYFVLKFFGLKSFSLLLGFCSTAIGIGTAGGGFIGSIVADQAGGYAPLAPYLGLSLLISGCLMFGLHFMRHEAFDASS